MDAYAKRNRRKKASGQGCVVIIVVGASVLVGLSYLLSSTAGWLA